MFYSYYVHFMDKSLMGMGICVMIDSIVSFCVSAYQLYVYLFDLSFEVTFST